MFPVFRPDDGLLHLHWYVLGLHPIWQFYNLNSRLFACFIFLEEVDHIWPGNCLAANCPNAFENLKFLCNPLQLKVCISNTSCFIPNRLWWCIFLKCVTLQIITDLTVGNNIHLNNMQSNQRIQRKIQLKLLIFELYCTGWENTRKFSQICINQ